MHPRPSAKAIAIAKRAAGPAHVVPICHFVWASMAFAMWWTLIGL